MSFFINKVKNNYGGILTVGLTVSFLLFYYGAFLMSPNSYMFSMDGDGLKNYYTFAYHVKHDVSFHHFTGMNFPYGDMHILTDGHALLAWSLQLIKPIFPFVSNYSVGILNSIFLWSMLLTSVVLYFLIKSYKVSELWSALFAVSIMVLAPQWDRIYGHFSLSYLFFIPLTWLWIKNFSESNKRRYIVYLFVLLFTLYFTHPYMGVISTLFILVYQAFTYFLVVEKRNQKFIIGSLFSAILPLLVFQMYVIILDDFDARSLNKYVYGDDFGEVKSIFAPHISPLSSFYREVFGVKNQSWEAWSYIGLSTVGVLLVMLFSTVKKGIKKEKQSWDNPQRIAWYTGLLILIVSLGIPLKYTGDFILESIPPIRQIRVMARFSWVFYYVATVYAVVFVYERIKRIENKLYKSALLIIIPVAFISLNFYESLVQHDKASQVLVSPNLFNYESISEDLKTAVAFTETQDYQAILSLPFFEIGTQRLCFEIANSEAFRNSLLLSYHSGLPLMNNCMSRSSETKAEQVMEVLIELYDSSKVLNSLDGSKAVLTYVHNIGTTTFDEHILNQITPVKTFDKFSFHKFIPNEVLVDKKEEVVKHYLSVKNKWFKDGSLLYDKMETTAIFETFDEYGTDTSKYFRGNKSLGGNYNDYHKIWEAPHGVLKKGKKYFISFWYYSKMDETNTIMFFLNEWLSNGKSEWTNVSDTRRSQRTIGDWSYLKLPFTPDFDEGKIEFFLHSKCRLNPRIYLDQFLIWEQGKTIYTEYAGELYKNNYPVAEFTDIYP